MQASGDKIQYAAHSISPSTGLRLVGVQNGGLIGPGDLRLLDSSTPLINSTAETLSAYFFKMYLTALLRCTDMIIDTDMGPCKLDYMHENPREALLLQFDNNLAGWFADIKNETIAEDAFLRYIENAVATKKSYRSILVSPEYNVT
jgi:hypothetical protein